MCNIENYIILNETRCILVIVAVNHLFKKKSFLNDAI